MGCWNETCAVSNLHIRNNQSVVCFVLTEPKYNAGFYDSTALYDFCPFPFYGKYNDYGAAEECSGVGLSVIMDALKTNLVEFPQGENQYHDILVERSALTPELLFNANLENRLYIDGLQLEWTKDGGAAMVNARQKLDIVMVHQEVVDAILSNWHLEQYRQTVNLDGSPGFMRYQYRFSDVAASVGEWVTRAVARADQEQDLGSLRWMQASMFTGLFNKDEHNLAAYWLQRLDDSAGLANTLVPVSELLVKLTQEGKQARLQEVVIELLKGLWVNAFMKGARKLWTPTTGRGSQGQDHEPYRILIGAMSSMLDAELKEFGEYE